MKPGLPEVVETVVMSWMVEFNPYQIYLLQKMFVGKWAEADVLTIILDLKEYIEDPSPGKLVRFE